MRSSSETAVHFERPSFHDQDLNLVVFKLFVFGPRPLPLSPLANVWRGFHVFPGRVLLHKGVVLRIFVIENVIEVHLCSFEEFFLFVSRIVSQGRILKGE